METGDYLQADCWLQKHNVLLEVSLALFGFELPLLPRLDAHRMCQVLHNSSHYIDNIELGMKMLCCENLYSNVHSHTM